ncbi:isoprenoid synthase domain-containing protein [Aspergillus spinulosporus]
METVASVCRYCTQIDPNSYDPAPTDHFSIYPVFSSKAVAVAYKASVELIVDFKRAAQADRLQLGLHYQAGITPLGSYIQWIYPDCLPERVALCAKACEYALHWDDVADVVSTEQNAELTRDLAIPMLEEVLQTGNRVEPKFEISKIGVKLMRDIIDMDRELGLGSIISWKEYLDGQAKSTHNDMSFELYIKHRFVGVAAMFAIELGCFAHDIHLTKEEKASVQHLAEAALTGCVLGNDYYSFNKEFDEHQRRGTLDRMQNAVALLMREYGYTEEEARSIVRSEIQHREREFIDGLNAWDSHAGPDCAELRRYLALVLMVTSGNMFWMSHAPRYHEAELSTTAKDRSTLVGMSRGALRVLEGYPPPRRSKRGAQEPLPDQDRELKRSKAEGQFVQRGVEGERCNRGAGIVTDQKSSQKEVNQESNDIQGVQPETVQPVNFMASFTVPFRQAPSEICDSPYKYIESLPSKNTRDKFMDSLNCWLQVPASSYERVKNIINMLHNASLMLDDIEDISSLRRGQPATHTFYGTSQTINSANFVYVKTVKEVMQLDNPECMNIFTDELGNLHRGQSLDLYWRHHGRCPTIDDYIMMVDNKTGGLFRLMLRLMVAESPISLPSSTSTLLLRLLTYTGRYYQIRDDYLNLTSADYKSKKGFCEDFDEGKFSLPLIHLLNHTPFPDRITSVIHNRNPETRLRREVKVYILDSMEAVRTFDYTREVLKHLHEEIMKTLDEVEGILGTNDNSRMLLLGMGVNVAS